MPTRAGHRPPSRAQVAGLVAALGRRLQEVRRTARGDPVQAQPVAKAEDLPVKPADWPSGPYDVILADPPWSYQNWTDAKNGAAVSAYNTMSVEQIQALPVAELAAKDCALVLWGTWPKLADAMATVSAWGFRYVSCLFVWRKTNADGTPYMGLGFYTRSGTEFALLGVRGSVPVDAKDVMQVVEAPVRAHSAKPPIVISKIERLWPNARRVELFCRSRWPKWDAWGDQVEPAMPMFDPIESTKE